MTHNSAIIESLSARIASNALKEVAKRLQAKGSTDVVTRLQTVIDALDEADTIHIADQAGRA